VHLPDALTTIFDLHSEFESHGFHARALFTMAQIDDAGDLTRALQAAAMGSGTILGASQAIGGEMLGAYGEIAYDLLAWLAPGSERSLSPFYRFEWYDTQRDMPRGFAANDAFEREIHTLGVQFEPLANVVLKADWRIKTAHAGPLEDEVNLGIGYAF
jgi:hypothetical protein